jgi:hypothetical protein
MYRCHFTYAGHIVAGVDLEARSLAGAIWEAKLGFKEQSIVGWRGGFEIWSSCLLHVTPDRPV